MPSKTSPSFNAFLFTGEDDFGIKRRIDVWKKEFAKKYSANAIIILDNNFVGPELINKLQEAVAPSLFSSKKLVIARDILPGSENLQQAILELLGHWPQNCFLVFSQSGKLDRRLGWTKKFLSLVEVTQFSLPHGSELNAWIVAEAKTLGIVIGQQAVEKLAVYLGRDLFEEKKFGGKVLERKEVFNLWQAHNELAKLASYSSNIKEQDVASLLKPKVNENVFLLSDEILNKNSKIAVTVLENLLSSSSTDEKSTIIKLVGLLAEQLKSLVLVAALSNQNLSQQQIAQKLGWNPGRVFIIQKHSHKVNPTQIKKLISNLLDIDLKLKSTDCDPKLLFNLFITHQCI